MSNPVKLDYATPEPQQPPLVGPFIRVLSGLLALASVVPIIVLLAIQGTSGEKLYHSLLVCAFFLLIASAFGWIAFAGRATIKRK